MLQRNQALVLAIAILAWGSAIVGGFVNVSNYETAAGPSTSGTAHWPAGSAIPFTPGRINIVMLAHPRCPCTRVSLDELQAFLREFPDRTTTHVLFWMPRQAGNEWRQTDLWKLADKIRDAQTYADEEGTEAHRFGASTSGHTLVFRDDGTRIFSGGLTAARGASGIGAKVAAICQSLDQESSLRPEQPVFGCPLFDLPSCDPEMKSCLK